MKSFAGYEIYIFLSQKAHFFSQIEKVDQELENLLPGEKDNSKRIERS